MAEVRGLLESSDELLFHFSGLLFNLLNSIGLFWIYKIV